MERGIHAKRERSHIERDDSDDPSVIFSVGPLPAH